MQAEDDPIAPKNAIPYAALEANPMCTLVVTPSGGHLGWGAGPDGPFGAQVATKRCCLLKVLSLKAYKEECLPCYMLHACVHAGEPWTDNASTEWLNSALLELYRTGQLPTKRAAPGGAASVGGRQGADRSVELELNSNGAQKVPIVQ